MKLSDILRAHVEKLKRMDDELNREILESVERCNNLLNELKNLTSSNNNNGERLPPFFYAIKNPT
jgi:flagellar hook-associated protein FlgK